MHFICDGFRHTALHSAESVSQKNMHVFAV